MKITKREHGAVKAATNEPILGADDDILDDPIDDTEGINDTLDDVADTLDDVQDNLEDVDEDEPAIEIENNIANHFIAECDGCQGIFISAVIESDQEIDHVSGVCPLCGKKTDQYLKWVIKEIDDAKEDEEFGIAREALAEEPEIDEPIEIGEEDEEV